MRTQQHMHQTIHLPHTLDHLHLRVPYPYLPARADALCCNQEEGIHGENIFSMRHGGLGSYSLGSSHGSSLRASPGGLLGGGHGADALAIAGPLDGQLASLFGSSSHSAVALAGPFSEQLAGMFSGSGHSADALTGLLVGGQLAGLFGSSALRSAGGNSLSVPDPRLAALPCLSGRLQNPMFDAASYQGAVATGSVRSSSAHFSESLSLWTFPTAVGHLSAAGPGRDGSSLNPWQHRPDGSGHSHSNHSVLSVHSLHLQPCQVPQHGSGTGGGTGGHRSDQHDPLDQYDALSARGVSALSSGATQLHTRRV